MNFNFLKQPPSPIMFSSHGIKSSVKEIYELEKERGNPTFDNIPLDWIEKNGSNPAIWLTVNPLTAFKYNLLAEEWDLSDTEIANKYPDYITEVVAVETSGMVSIAEDSDGGFF